MKKRYISCVVTLALVVSIAVSAFATENLNLKVFHGEDDITVFPSTDGDVTISVDSMGKSTKGTIVINNTVVHFLPMVIASQKYDMFCMTVDFFHEIRPILTKSISKLATIFIVLEKYK